VNLWVQHTVSSEDKLYYPVS